MSTNKEDDSKRIVAQLAEDVYEDGLKTPVQEVGKIVGLVPRLIHAALVPLEKWIVNREYSLKMTEKLLQEKLENFKAEEVDGELKAFVAVPAINALSYSIGDRDLLNMYANLLASSMVKSEKWKVHPSFVEIIKQLSPDEARLLKIIATTPCDNEYPLINLVMSKEEKDDNYHITVGRTMYYVVKNFTTIGENVCEFFSNISSYIENLVRFNIIEIDNHLVVTDRNYESLDKHSFITDAKNNNSLREGFHWECEHFMFMVTNFGKAFISTCVLGPNKEETL